MSKLILLAGALALLAAAGATTLAFRVTTPELTEPAAAGPLAEHLREMREEMELP
ncbi:MAG: hypothetical protein WA728_36055 [Xanthobacteraceae bacterium]